MYVKTMIILYNELHFLSVDDNRITLQSIVPFTKCQRDFINASYIDVRLYIMLLLQYNILPVI